MQTETQSNADILFKMREKCRFNPQFFASKILRLELDEWQIEFIEAVVDVERHHLGMRTVINHKGKNKLTCTSMHGPGKTFELALLMHYWQWTREGRVVCTATKERQILTRLFPEFRTIGKKAVPGYEQTYDAQGNIIYWNNDKDYFAIAETAKEPENLAGYHHDYLLFLVDEASGINEQMFPVIEGAISTGIVPILVMIGNPTKTSGSFYLSHKSPKIKQEYFSYHIPLSKTPRIKKEWLTSMANKYGATSSIYKIRCLGEFAEDDDNQLISASWVYDSIQVDAVMPDGSNPSNRISADIADGGANETVIASMRRYNTFDHFIKLKRYNYDQKTAVHDAYLSCVHLMERMDWTKDNTMFYIDGVGVGAGTSASLIANGYRVVKVKGGERSSDTKVWANQRSQMYCSLADRFREERIKIDRNFCEEKKDWDDLLGQCTSIQRKEDEDKLERIESKRDMRRRSIVSPDIADCMAQFYAKQVLLTKDAGNLVKSLIIGDRTKSEYRI